MADSTLHNPFTPPQPGKAADLSEFAQWAKVHTGLRFLMIWWSLLLLQQVAEAYVGWKLQQSGTLPQPKIYISAVVALGIIVTSLIAYVNFLYVPQKRNLHRFAQLAAILGVAWIATNVAVHIVASLGSITTAISVSRLSRALHIGESLSLLWFLLRLSESENRGDIASNLKIAISIRVVLYVCLCAGAAHSAEWAPNAMQWTHRGLIVFQLYTAYPLLCHVSSTSQLRTAQVDLQQ